MYLIDDFTIMACSSLAQHRFIHCLNIVECMLLNRCTIVQTRLVFWTQVLSEVIMYRDPISDPSTTMMPYSSTMMPYNSTMMSHNSTMMPYSTTMRNYADDPYPDSGSADVTGECNHMSVVFDYAKVNLIVYIISCRFHDCPSPSIRS